MVLKSRTLLAALAAVALFTGPPGATPAVGSVMAAAVALEVTPSKYDDPNFYTDETATPGIYLVSYVDGLGDGEREPEEEGSDPGGGSEAGSNGAMFGSPTEPADPAEICSDYGATLEETMDDLGVFVASMSETQARAMSHDSRVEFVEGDREGEGATTQVLPGDLGFWGLDVIDQRTPIRSNSFTYTNTGASVHAYVLDSGVYATHEGFGGRVTLEVKYAGSTLYDNVGHGTAVASILGGDYVGVAKAVQLHSVRVLNDSNKFKLWQLAKGLKWVKNHYQLPAVVNMSLGVRAVPYIPFITMGTPPLEKATKRLINRGITVVVAAMNNNAVARNYVPAKVLQAITVGAARSDWSRTSFTNFGSRVDVFGPGESLVAAINGSLGYSSGWLGTSFASPFVAGVACQYLQTHPLATPAEVDAWIKANATPNAVTGTFLVATTRSFVYTNL